MKNLTKKDVCVKIDTKEKCKRVLEILKDETVYSGVTDNIREIGLNDGYEWLALGLSISNTWSGYKTLLSDKTPVTLEQLAEILCVKQQFKVGDRVRIKESSEYYKYGDDYNPIDTDGIITELNDNSDYLHNTRVKWNNCKLSWYKGDLDLELIEAGKETTIETVTISRANLGRLYPIVCSSWQSYITYLLDDAGSFAVDVQVHLEKLRQAYKEANHTQKAILIEVAPLPKVKSTVNISRWVNLYGNAEGNLYRTEEEALRSKYFGCVATIELTGEYTTEVEDPLMDLDEIPF